MASYLVGTGEQSAGAASPRPCGFPRAALIAELGFGGYASPRPAGFPLAVVATLAGGSTGVLFAKAIFVSAGEGAGGVTFAKTILVTPVEGLPGLLLARTVIATIAEGSSGPAIARLWIVGLGECSAGIIAERPAVRHWLDACGLFRVFNAEGYRFYRSTVGPPAEGSAPFATAVTLPYAPTATFADGAWFLSVSYFNGVLDSGFLPLGDSGETYLRLDIASGVEAASPPSGPLDWRVEAAAGGAVRIVAVASVPIPEPPEALEWAIAYTTDGSSPAADSPDLSEDLPLSGLAVLDYALPAAADSATVKVRLQIRRNDGTADAPDWKYSEGSTVLTIVADATGPTAAIAADRWAGPLPVDEG